MPFHRITTFFNRPIMKYLIILLALSMYELANAQQGFDRTYKKARAFTITNQDSALVWATKCIGLAQTKSEKYRAHYLHGFNAFKLCMFGTALYDYEQARKFSPDSLSWSKSTNSLADTYLNAGRYSKAVQLNQQSIDFNLKTKKWVKLSYAYNVKSNILRKIKDKEALVFIRKALQLRKKHAPQQVGYVYEEAAKVFATFQKYDSAVVYQRLALKHYPNKSSNIMTSLHTQLAQYLIMAQQESKALTHLQKARFLKKNGMRQLFWHHTFGLYLLRIQQIPKARQIFAYSDSLLQNLLDKAPDWVTQRTISEYAQEMYRDLLALRQIKASDRKLYQARLELVKATYAHANSEIKYQDTLYQQRLTEKTSPVSVPDITKRVLPWYWWLVTLMFTLALGGLIWKVY